MNEFSLSVGSEVTMIFFPEKGPQAVKGIVVESFPLVIKTDVAQAGEYSRARRTLLVLQNSDNAWKSEGIVSYARAENDEWYLEVTAIKWDDLDRRRYPRHSVAVGAQLRFVVESENGPCHADVHCSTKDLSLGGASLESTEAIPEKTLVNVRFDLGKDGSAQVLSLVVREKQGDVGLEFLDYIGGSRYLIYSYLMSQAA